MRFVMPAEIDKDTAEGTDKALAMTNLTDLANMPAQAMSYGEQRQLEIAMLLALEPEVLLLDEPLAGLGGNESQAVIDLIRRLALDHGIVLIEHDMDAVFALADRISVLVYGRVIATGTVDEIRANPEVRRAYLGDE